MAGAKDPDTSAGFEKILLKLKSQAKQVMEEAAVKRFVCEDGNSVTSLCATVEQCLRQGLRHRIFGLFGTVSTFALLHKIAPCHQPATTVLQMTIHAEKRRSIERRTSDSSETPALKTQYLWIRLALTEKLLAQIVNHVAQNAADTSRVAGLNTNLETTTVMFNKYVVSHKDILVSGSEPDKGGNYLYLGHLVFTTENQLAKVKRVGSFRLDETDKPPNFFNDYFLSLHQNTRSFLIYGKNNVVVCPTDSATPMKGYLSLHQSNSGEVQVKWTPNVLMQNSASSFTNKSLLWKNAMIINLQDIVCLHCHYEGASNATAAFVAADGIQHPTLCFPSASHLLDFLNILETALKPSQYLDPPLQNDAQRGKNFPVLKSMQNAASVDGSVNSAHDYLFRVISFEDKPANGNSVETQVKLTKKSALADHANFVSMAGLSSRLKERFQSFQVLQAKHANIRTTLHEDRFEFGDGGQKWVQSNLADSVCGEPSTALVKAASESAAEPKRSVSEEVVMRETLQSVYDSMKHQIICRAFYGWLALSRHMKTVRSHLAGLVRPLPVRVDYPTDASGGITNDNWAKFIGHRTENSELEFYRYVYFGGISQDMRKEVWPYLLGVFKFDSTKASRSKLLRHESEEYEDLVSQWMAVETIVHERDKELVQKSQSRSSSDILLIGKDYNVSNEVFVSEAADDGVSVGGEDEPLSELNKETVKKAAARKSTEHSRDSGFMDSVDRPNPTVARLAKAGSNVSHNSCESVISETADGCLFSKELIDLFSVNLHRIEKDVHRCDRNHPYFTTVKLEKLKNVMCTYVWKNLERGYVQGMCDLLAPLLVIFDEELISYLAFKVLMDKLAESFPHAGGAMDANLSTMRLLLQVIDNELFDLMYRNGDYTHCYFCYRWFLLDFKRELTYENVFRVWETIWAAFHVSSTNFSVFFAMALTEHYRDIILENDMDFTDIIRFFNEMAEKHEAVKVLALARKIVERLQLMLEPKGGMALLCKAAEETDLSGDEATGRSDSAAATFAES